MFLQSGDKGRGRTCCRWYPSSTLAQTPQPCNPVEGYTDIQRCGPCTHRWDCGSVCVHIHGHVAVVRAAHCEPSRYAPPPISSVSRQSRTKRLVGAPVGIDLLLCVPAQWGHTGAAHSSITST